MNSKIQELIKQCSTDNGSYDPYGEDRIIIFDQEKFAKLLLGEALATVRQEVGYYADYDIADLIVTNVEKQFGIS
jgi:hypothetical protein